MPLGLLSFLCCIPRRQSKNTDEDPPPPYEPHDHTNSKDKGNLIHSGLVTGEKNILQSQDSEKVQDDFTPTQAVDAKQSSKTKSLVDEDRSMQAGPSNPGEPPRLTGEEDEEKLLAYYLPMLSKYDTVILLDDSYSMLLSCGFKRKSEYSYPSRWEMVTELIGSLAGSLAMFDTDGIDVHFLNNKHASGSNLKSRKAVEALLNPGPPHGVVTPTGSTYIGGRLENLFRAYEKSAEADPSRHPKKVNYIVFTDGEASDKAMVERAIEKHARWLDERKYPEDQVGIQFFQIGNDHKAAKYLQELDDDLKARGVRDIVDTTQYVGSDLTVLRIVKVCLGGVNKRLDAVRLTVKQ